MDKIVSCFALLVLAITSATGAIVFGYQCLGWLQTASWRPMPLSEILATPSIAIAWTGLGRLYGWFLNLPLSLTLIIVGFVFFWLGGIVSAYLYRRAAAVASTPVTPAQTHA